MTELSRSLRAYEQDNPLVLDADGHAGRNGGLLTERLSKRYADRITGNFMIPGREGSYAPIPDDVPEAIEGRVAGARHRPALQPPGRGLGRRRRRGEHVVVVTPTASGKTLCYTLPVVAAAHDRQRQGAVPVSDQGAGAGPGGRAAGTEPRRRAGREGLHLRRRHAGRCAPGDPPAWRHRGQQSGHAAPGDPAASHQVGAVLREPALRRDRRGAHLPRRVRHPRGQRAAPAQARLRVLWRATAVHPVLGDDRQPAGACRGPDRGSRACDHRERRAHRRQARAAVEPAGGQCRPRPARLGAFAEQPHRPHRDQVRTEDPGVRADRA